jgi:signal transduction histidine kinase
VGRDAFESRLTPLSGSDSLGQKWRKSRLKKNANSLTIDCPDDLGTMRADQTKIRQTLFNLLSNAAKFTKRGTISLTVERERDDWITFAVSDTGIQPPDGTLRFGWGRADGVSQWVIERPVRGALGGQR